MEGGPSIFIISFLFVLLIKIFACFFSKKLTPWTFITLFKEQFKIKNKDKKINIIFFMNTKYLNIYNNLVQLTRNKSLYRDFKVQDTFSDRLIFLLLHFAFFLKVFKNDHNKKILQEIYDFFFRQLELSIREIGYGDQSINKKMKDYINLFYSMIEKLHNWESLSSVERRSILSFFLNSSNDTIYLVDYFEKYRFNLSNNPLSFYIKGVIKP